MRAILLVLVLGLISCGASGAQSGPLLFHEAPGGAPLAPNPDACWSEPPDLNGVIATSEIIVPLGFGSQLGNDFVFDSDRTITKIRWWGGYYSNTVPCDPGITPPGFNLLFYTNEDCFPPYFWVPTIQLFIQGSAGETSIGCQGQAFPLFRYEANVSVPIPGGVRHWFVPQMADHPFPPQWGRLAAGTITGCESVFGRLTLEGYDWTIVQDVFGIAFDVSQEFECESVVPSKATSWGRIKSLYR